VYALKKLQTLLIVGFLMLLIPLGTAQANSNKLYWSEVQQASYQPLHPNTLNWSGDVLDKGGMSLADLKLTTDSSKADFVMNQYGAIGASSILKLSEELEAPTFRNQSNFLNSYTMAAGDVYLVSLHDGKYAKIRIDRVAANQVNFSYVLETEEPKEEEPQAPTTPAAQPTPKPTPKPTEQKPTEGQATQEQQKPSTSPASAKSSIKLTIGNRNAVVQGKNVTLDVAPTVVNGNTLVPLRFLSESLGAEVKWFGDERKITLTQQENKIDLWIDKPSALVNGRTIALEAAPEIMDDTTVVPLRFISETFKQEVHYNADTRAITITGEAGTPQPSSNTAQSPNGQGFVVALMGNWDVYYKESWMPEKTATGSLSISQYGTYELKMKGDGEYAGVWYIAKENEVEDHPEAIIIKNAMKKSDWAIVPRSDGTVELLERYAWSNNALYNPTISVMWTPIYEGVKASEDPDHIDNFVMKDYDFDVFVGSYDLWIEGGATNLYYRDTGNYATHEYNGGAGMGTLVIYADGTYEMNTTEKRTGIWRPSKVNEVYSFEHSIILENGPDDMDWAVHYTGSGKTGVSYEDGYWNDGSKIWLPYYIASPSK
jgi:hypothetical protein